MPLRKVIHDEVHHNDIAQHARRDLLVDDALVDIHQDAKIISDHPMVSWDTFRPTKQGPVRVSLICLLAAFNLNPAAPIRTPPAGPVALLSVRKTTLTSIWSMWLHMRFRLLPSVTAVWLCRLR